MFSLIMFKKIFFQKYTRHQLSRPLPWCLLGGKITYFCSGIRYIRFVQPKYLAFLAMMEFNFYLNSYNRYSLLRSGSQVHLRSFHRSNSNIRNIRQCSPTFHHQRHHQYRTYKCQYNHWL